MYVYLLYIGFAIAVRFSTHIFVAQKTLPEPHMKKLKRILKMFTFREDIGKIHSSRDCVYNA